MPLSVSKQGDWQPSPFVKIPAHLILCRELSSTSKLLFIALINQVGFRPVSVGTIDRMLGIHRSTRIRCLEELRSIGLVGGSDSHLTLKDPSAAFAKLKKERQRADEEAEEMLGLKGAPAPLIEGEVVTAKKERVDHVKAAADAWNKYRPLNYRSIRRMSAKLVQAVDTHIKDVGYDAHDYETFFSVLQAGVEASDFWAKQNNNKTLESIVGIGVPTDRKRSNVYNLINAGIENPMPAGGSPRREHVILPAACRKLIDEYDSAQYFYNEAYLVRSRTPIPQHVKDHVIRAEADLISAGLDPADFRSRYCIDEWPTATPEPEGTRVEFWSFDDEH